MRTRSSLVVGSLLFASACGETPPATPGAPTTAETTPVLENYAAILYAGYSDSVDGAIELREAVTPLGTGAPTAAALTTARETWTAARLPYMETEIARFYEGPIDDPETGPESLINSWPMDEAYVDYVVGGDGVTLMHGGLINMPTELETIDADSIAELNQPGTSEENVSTGWHAIEFLLWGQDLDEDGAGARPFTDYLETGGTAMNQDRRRAYLVAVSDLLVDDLTEVRDAWAPTRTNYRSEFVALAPEEGLRRILFGLGSLAGGELATERINVAYTTQEQEDEHSCFSDTTLNDHLHDAIGIRNIYTGRYERVDGSIVSGASLSDLVAARDDALDTRIRGEIDAAIASIEAIPGPFDQAILGADTTPGRMAIAQAREDLRTVAASLVDVADTFGILLNLE